MDKEQKDHRDRLIALGFVSLLLIVVYGPAAGWFVAVDRFVYDQIASRIQQQPLTDAVLVSTCQVVTRLPAVPQAPATWTCDPTMTACSGARISGT